MAKQGAVFNIAATVYFYNKSGAKRNIGATAYVAKQGAMRSIAATVYL